MQLSKFTDYAFRTLIYLARNQEKNSIIEEMAIDLDLSKDHLKKVVNKLAKTEYITSTKGRNGGLRLGTSPDRINLGEVLKLTEENMNIVECMSGDERCGLMKDGCRLKALLGNALEQFIEEMGHYTLQDIL